MRTDIDTHGVVILRPETDSDKRTLFHLLNCADLTRFTEYLEYAAERECTGDITEDLGANQSEVQRLMHGVPLTDGIEPLKYNAETESTEWTEDIRPIGFKIH